MALLLLVLIAGCSPLAIGTPRTTPKAPYTLAPPTPKLSPIATVGPSEPGRPYTAEAIIDEFNDVPNGFPPQLRTPAIAASLAEGLWTYDGQPYRALALQGSCDDGGARCDLTVTGLPGFVGSGDASDAYFWSVIPSSGVLVAAGARVLKGYPPDLDPELDAMARVLDTGRQLASLELLGAEWLPPDGFFVLRYGHGLEEGDPTLLVTLDYKNKRILSVATQ